MLVLWTTLIRAAPRDERVPGLTVPLYGTMTLGLVSERRIARAFGEFEPDQIARAAAALVKLPELRAQMSQRARETVAGRTWSAVGDELVGVYHGLLEVGLSDTATAA